MKARYLRLAFLFLVSAVSLSAILKDREADSTPLVYTPIQAQDYEKLTEDWSTPTVPNYDLLGAPPTPHWFNSIEDIPKQSFNCKIIVRPIRNGKPADEGTSGSGTYFYDNGTDAAILTCYHLFDWPKDSKLSIKCVFFNVLGQPATVDAEIVVQNPEHDIVVLRTTPLPIIAASLSVQSDEGPFTVCGYPLGKYSHVVGNYIGHSDPDRGGRVSHYLDHPVQRGFSGGGVFNSKGELSGVLWGSNFLNNPFGPDFPVTKCYFISTLDLREFIQSGLDKIKARTDTGQAIKGQNKLVVVSIPGCAPCVKIKPIVKGLAKEGYDSTYVMLEDYKGPERPQLFPAIYVYRDNKLIHQTAGYMSKKELLALINMQGKGNTLSTYSDIRRVLDGS